MAENSPAPGVPQTAHKAVWGGILAFLVAFAAALLLEWSDSDPLEARDFVVAFVLSGAGGGLTGGVVRQVKNRRK